MKDVSEVKIARASFEADCGAGAASCAACETELGVRTNEEPSEGMKAMGYVVPFMNGKGGTGKSVLARAYAVEAARAGASVLIADLDDVQRTSKHWADHRKANGLKPEIRVEVATPRLACDMEDRSDVLVIDTPGWTDREI